LKKAANIFLLAFYSFGIFCLPMGDFSSLNELTEMYHHCKATEDKDMTLIDFITDHLINVDCIFDKHENGDKQKPHNPIQFHHIQQTYNFATKTFKVCDSNFAIILKSYHNFEEGNYCSNFHSNVFRPPIV